MIKGSNSDLSVAPITPSDIEIVNDFHNIYYSERRSINEWNWLFGSRRKLKSAFVVAKYKGEVVGTQALIPIHLNFSGSTLLSAKSEETLISPHWRGKGIFALMYKELLKWCHDEDVKVIWGFTPAQRAFTEIGFDTPFKTSQLIKIMDIRVAKLSILETRKEPLTFKENGGIAFGRFISASRELNTFWRGRKTHLTIGEISITEASSIMDEFSRSWKCITLDRNLEFLQWRMGENPFIRPLIIGAWNGEKLMGWIALSIDENSTGFIVDSLVPQSLTCREILEALLYEAMEIFRKCGVGLVRTWSVNSNAYDQFFSKVSNYVGFLPYPVGEGMVMLPLQDYQKLNISLNDWYISRVFTQGIMG